MSRRIFSFLGWGILLSWLPSILLGQTAPFFAKEKARVWIDAKPASTDQDRSILNYHERPKKWALPTQTWSFEDLSQMSLFTVFVDVDTLTEQVVWALTEEDSDLVLLTTRRLADLQHREFINFLDQQPGAPQINTYFHHRNPLKTTTLRLAATPKLKSIPALPFKGTLAEMLVFDRVLSPVHRQMTETYLAIKYGITLRQNYLAPDGQVIKEVEDSKFAYRIAGLGNNPAFGLDQRQATSASDKGLLSMGRHSIRSTNEENPHQLPADHYLIWSDNNDALQAKQRRILQIPHLQRTWEMHRTGRHANLQTELNLNVALLSSPSIENQTVWLAIQSEPDGGQITYHSAEAVTADKTAIFKNINWGAMSSEKSYFTFGFGPKLIPNVNIRSPRCVPNEEGILYLEANGGTPPIQYSIREKSGRVVTNGLLPDHDRYRVRLPSGEYHLTLADAAGSTYEETFFFEAEDAPDLSLEETYYLPDGKSLTIEADKNGDAGSFVDYQWINTAGEILNRSSELSIDQVGTYTVIATDHGCEARRTIEVVRLRERDNIADFSVFPNPSIDGHFKVRASFHQASPATINIYDPAGRLVRRQHFASGKDIEFPGRLQLSGHYWIELTSRNSSQSQPIILQLDR